MSKRVIILAGGVGTRLKPYTIALPKPLVPVGDYPIMEIIIRQLAHYGFDKITLTVGHLGDIIKAYFGDGRKWNIKIDYSLEEKPMNTMGPLTLINDLPENFLVMNGDVLTNLNFDHFFNYHIQQNNLFSISGYKRNIHSEFGVLEVNKKNYLDGFSEKPIINYVVSMGVYMVNKSILNYIPQNEAFGFDQLMLRLIEKNKPASVKMFNGYWQDIGRPNDYEIAIRDFKNNPSFFLSDE